MAAPADGLCTGTWGRAGGQEACAARLGHWHWKPELYTLAGLPTGRPPLALVRVRPELGGARGQVASTSTSSDHREPATCTDRAGQPLCPLWNHPWPGCIRHSNSQSPGHGTAHRAWLAMQGSGPGRTCGAWLLLCVNVCGIEEAVACRWWTRTPTKRLWWTRASGSLGATWGARSSRSTGRCCLV